MNRVSKIAELSEETISEMAMIDLAHLILSESKEPIYYQDLIGKVMELKQVSQEEINQQLARVYTEMNIDARFACIGDNAWGLRSWYPVDALVDAANTGVSFDDEEFDEYEDEDFDSEDFDDGDKATDEDEEEEEDLDEEEEEDEDLIAEDEDEEMLAEDDLEFEDDEELLDVDEDEVLDEEEEEEEEEEED